MLVYLAGDKQCSYVLALNRNYLRGENTPPPHFQKATNEKERTYSHSYLYFVVLTTPITPVCNPPHLRLVFASMKDGPVVPVGRYGLAELWIYMNEAQILGLQYRASLPSYRAAEVKSRTRVITHDQSFTWSRPSPAPYTIACACRMCPNLTDGGAEMPCLRLGLNVG